MNFHLLTISAILELLNTNKQGLHIADTEERLKQYGKNELIPAVARLQPSDYYEKGILPLKWLEAKMINVT